jgi:hypothetical protein
MLLQTVMIRTANQLEQQPQLFTGIATQVLATFDISIAQHQPD